MELPQGDTKTNQSWQKSTTTSPLLLWKTAVEKCHSVTQRGTRHDRKMQPHHYDFSKNHVVEISPYESKRSQSWSIFTVISLWFLWKLSGVKLSPYESKRNKSLWILTATSSQFLQKLAGVETSPYQSKTYQQWWIFTATSP